MSSTQSLDRDILAIVEEHQPASMKRIMDRMNKDHTRAGKSNAGVTQRIYTLKREGILKMIGIGKDAQYALPDYKPDAQPSERQRQIAEGQARDTAPIIRDLYVKPAVVVVESDDDLPEGWSTLRQQLDEPEEIVQMEPITTTTQPSIVQRAPLSLSISALAGDVAAQVAMTVERVVGQDIKRYEAVIADLQKTLADRDQEIARAREELIAAEQLGAEAEAKYNELREKLRAL